MDRAGGISAIIRTLRNLPGKLIHANAMTVTGRTIAQNTARAKILDEQVIRQPAHAYSQEGVWLSCGNLAPDGAR